MLVCLVLLVSVEWKTEVRVEVVLQLAITTMKPRANMAITASLSLSDIWSRDTMVMGRQMMTRSEIMLTVAVSAGPKSSVE